MSSTPSRTYEPTPARKVAFLGLGVMGYPMAGHLARAGHQVTVYNRTATKSIAWCAEYAGAGGQNHAQAATPREAARGADIVFCCVGNDDDLRAVTLGARTSSTVVVTQGLKAGERVVVEGSSKVRPGQSVRVVDVPVVTGATPSDGAQTKVSAAATTVAANDRGS